MNNNFITSHKLSQGFTLIELMIGLVIMSILLAIAIPSYNEYGRKAALGNAQQEMLKLAEQLERHKARNFSYKGFNASYLYTNNTGVVASEFSTVLQEINFPLAKQRKFVITIVDGMAGNPLLTNTTSLGQSWVIRAVSDDPKNFNLLLSSTGIRCKSKNTVTYTECSGENW